MESEEEIFSNLETLLVLLCLKMARRLQMLKNSHAKVTGKRGASSGTISDGKGMHSALFSYLTSPVSKA